MAGYGWYRWQMSQYSRGKFEWVPCHKGQIPPGAVKAGKDSDNTPLYAGRALHNKDLLPAKVKPNHHGAYVAWGGQEHSKDKYEVLVSADIAWQPAQRSNIPPQAMVVGQTDSGENLYLGRTEHEGTITPGKVQASHNCIYIPYGGKEISKPNYEIMVLL